jgi:hypothetical protein
MPQRRAVKLRRSQLVWLALIVAVGLVVGVIAGVWWGIGAAVVVLLVSEIVERVQRARAVS